MSGALSRAAIPLDSIADTDAVLELIDGDARVVLLGEATHGSAEFYRYRAELTQRLVAERGFTIVAVEADWPDAYRVNRYVRGASPDASAVEALDDFRRFTTWMWRNTEVVRLAEWLREWNATKPPERPAVGFYGLDLYSLHSSIDAVLRYLDDVDPEAARRARYRYGCFEHFGEDSRAYGYAAEIGAAPSCEDAAVEQLLDLQRHAAELASRDGRIPEDEHFFAEQNARLVRNAEEYYRAMFRRRTSSWNLRDRHMAETLNALLAHFDGKGQNARAVVWAHNSHIGDARATEMGEQGEWNIGQLVRAQLGRACVLIGFTTHTGSVTAASGWDAPAERKRMRPSLAGSVERLLHDTGEPRLLLPLRGAMLPELEGPLLERAIGVVYLPQTERVSHYFHAHVAAQFDALIHVDETSAVEPLERTSHWESGDAPETFPSGL